MPKWLKKMLIRWGWPIAKQEAIDLIQNEELQRRIVEKLRTRQDIPALDADQEKRLRQFVMDFSNNTYDLVQEVLVEYVENIDIRKLLEKLNAQK